MGGKNNQVGMRAAAAALLAVIGVLFLLVPGTVEAHFGQYGGGSCTGCHTPEAGGTFWVAVDGVDVSGPLSVSASPGQTLEIDYYFSGARGASDNDVGVEVLLPDTNWTVAQGTNNAPSLPAWNATWNLANASNGGVITLFNPPEDNAFTVNWDTTPYDSGNSDVAMDTGAEPDGTADRMGVDFRVTVDPAASGAYSIVLYGVGHTGNGRTSKSVTLTVNVSGGNTPPSSPTSPAQYQSDGTTAVALGGYSTTTTLVFEGDLSDPDGDTVKLQVDYTGDSISDCESALVASGSANVQVTCPGLADGSGYDWQYRAVDSVGANSAWTAFNATSPDFTVDASAPTDGVLTPTPGDTQIVLNWTAATDATSGLASPGYTVSMATGTTTPPADCTANIIYTGDLLTHTETGLANGTDYAFRVCATDNAGWTSTGATATAQPAAGNTAPNAPANLAQYRLDGTTPIALGGTTTEGSVVFEADISDADGGDTIKLQIDTNSDGISDCESALGANPATNVQVTCALADGGYDWQARTVDNSAATSAWVPYNAASPDFVKDASPPVDGTLTASPGDTEIVLTWTAATDPHSGLSSPAYTVSMASGTTTPPADCSAGVIYTGDALTHTETGLVNGTDYAFRLCATNNAGLVSSGTTETAQPAAGCVEADPTVSILTASQDITSDGGFVNYTVQVTNNDSVTCGSTAFSLSASDTNGTNFFASTLADASLTIAPGTSAQTQVRVTARAGQPNAVSNDTTVSTAAVSLKNAVTSAAVTTTINVVGGGCVPSGDYLNTNGDRFITSR